MNKAVKAIVAAAFTCCAFVFSAAWADEVAFGGKTITYSGAEQALVGDDLLLIYRSTSETGTLSFAGSNARVRILLVGGGGAGGSVGTKILSGAAGGGGAGGMVDRELSLVPGDYTVQVGAGGKRVHTVLNSWVGDMGGDTTLKRGSTIVASVPGGGGGGAPKANGGGMAGGAGGGGSWYLTSALPGGTGVDGIGWAGGTPVSADIGGGGGGSAKGQEGRGGTNGVAGVGRKSDITGSELTYAEGGRGGNRTDSSYIANDGIGIGHGGDGAATGFGGAGGAGIVIIRFTKMFDYKKVPLPAFTDSFTFTNGADYCAFDFSAQPQLFQEAVASITGTTNLVGVTDEIVNTYQRFTVSLKDEYVWDFGENGTSATDYICNWRIVDADTIGLAGVQIQKNVLQIDGAKAKIAIDVHMTPEKIRRIPNVLMLGSLCGAHGLSHTVINTALNTICEVGNVDYYFWNRVDSTDNANPYFSGKMLQGQSRSLDARVDAINPNNNNAEVDINNAAGNHGTIYGFYKKIADLIRSREAEKYEYILFCFDRTLVAGKIPGQHPDEAMVKDYLIPFYESGSVIWLVDNSPANCNEYRKNSSDGNNSNTRVTVNQTPWFPSPLVCISPTSGDPFWASLDYYEGRYGSKSGTYPGWTAYRALMGLFDPKHYPTSDTTYRNNSMYSHKNNSYYNNITTAKINALAGDVNTNQCVYSDADEVKDLVSRAVVARVFTAALKDRVRVEMGLDVKNADASWSTNNTDWTALTSDQLKVESDGVKIDLGGIDTEAWIKLVIDVEDNGSFLSNQGATYNERTGQWEKDPNDGPVKVTMTPDGATAILAEAEKATSISWSFNAYNVSASVVGGEGDVVINGFKTPSISVGEGYSPEVQFLGKAGYVMNYLEIDGQEVKDFDPSVHSWTFDKIGANHDVKVGFERVAMKLLRVKQRYPWNNLVDLDYFIGGDDAENTSAVFGRLAFFVEYDSEDGSGRVTKQLKTFRDNDELQFNWPFAGEAIRLGDDAYSRLRAYGYHRVTWDANADGVDIFQKKRVKFTLRACEGIEK